MKQMGIRHLILLLGILISSQLLIGQEVITLQTQRKAGEKIKLKIEATGAYKIEGVQETPAPNKVSKEYTLTGSVVKLLGDITYLSCAQNDLKVLDLLSSSHLVHLDASLNALTELTVSEHPNLEQLNVYGNQLQILDVSHNSMVKVLDLSQNALRVLKLGSLPMLEELGCSNNQLKTIDISLCPKINSLLCYNNRIPLDHMLLIAQYLHDKKENTDKTWVVVDSESGIEKNECSQSLVAIAESKGWDVYDWKKTQLDVYAGSADPKQIFTRPIVLQTNKAVGAQIQLTVNGIGDIQIVGIKEKVTPSPRPQNFTLTGQTIKIQGYITQIGAPGQEITSIDLGNTSSLTWLYVANNKITSIDLANCPSLRTLHCASNQIETLNLSNHKALELVNCCKNKVQVLDLALASELEDLRCGSNSELREVRLSPSASLSYLECASGKITSLNLTPYKKTLTTVYCFENQLQSLDVADCSLLKVLYCGYNQIKSLSLGNSPLLFELACGSNGIEGTIDLTQCPKAETLLCSGNKISQILVSPQGALNYVDCYINKLSKEATKALVEGLPTDPENKSEITLIDSQGKDYDNAYTSEDIARLYQKGWTVFDNHGDNPQEIPNSTGITCTSVDNDSAIRLYPNPVIETLHIEIAMPYQDVRISTIDGRLVKRLTTDAQGTASVSFASWTQAVYLVQIGEKTYRIIHR